MASHFDPTPPDAPSGTTPEAASPATQALPAAEALDPAAQRLRYLFRRLDAEGQTHVLKKALFEYRGIELP
ncbi:MAG: hypothetical protein ACK4OH_15285 [Acidovorax temperans]|uniref:hypothetical protein n=1 Tax=Acidovorax temperans TaxID=80878 RepID=UPI003918BB3B